LGTNYLNYAAIDGAITQCTLFTIYTLLIYLIIQFNKESSLLKSIGIAAIIGLGALTRPSEIISCIIPLLGGGNLFKSESVVHRISCPKKKFKYITIDTAVCLFVGSAQLFYLKIYQRRVDRFFLSRIWLLLA